MERIPENFQPSYEEAESRDCPRCSQELGSNPDCDNCAREAGWSKEERGQLQAKLRAKDQRFGLKPKRR